MTKSEVEFRNTPAYIHFKELTNVTSDERCIVLSLSDRITNRTTNVIDTLNGRVFDGLTLEQTYPQNVIEIDPVSGRPLLEHSTFDSESNSELLKFFTESSQKVALKMHITGRVSFVVLMEIGIALRLVKLSLFSLNIDNLRMFSN